MLFPELIRSPHHGWARNTTRWINEEYLTRLGVKTDRQIVFHSFRHTVADNFKQTWKTNPLKVSAYLGHKDDFGKRPTWQKTYGSPFSPTDLIEVAEAIDFKLDLKKFKKEVLDKIRFCRNRGS